MISEIVLNIYIGICILIKKCIKMLKIYELDIRLLGFREVSNKEKCWILYKCIDLVFFLLKFIVLCFF